MPTMDLDAHVRALCKGDPRYRPEAFHFVLEALDFTLARRGGSPARAPEALPAGDPAPGVPPAVRVDLPAPSNVGGRDLLEGFRDLALERFGALALEVLRTWGVTTTDDVGALVFRLVEGGLLQRTSTDSPADYHAVFDFPTTFDRGFQDRLRRDEVRLADRPPG
jgi:uncharacterized repeat protein (TIGR04138 family)